MVNSNLYHYAGNNPVKYTDPDGKDITNAYRTLMKSADNATLGNSSVKIKDQGCVLTAYTRMASAILGREVSLSESNMIGIENKLFTGKEETLLSPQNGAALVNAILEKNGVTDTSIAYDGSYTGEGAVSKYLEANSSESSYFATIRVNTHDADGNKYDHTMNLDCNAYSYSDCGENIKVNDTSGVRQQLVDDPSGRKNTFLRMDLFIINKPQGCAQE